MRNCGGGLGRRALTLVLLVAFCLQSFVTQTHLHATHAAGSALVAFQSPHTGKAPLDEGVAACPFCQATIHAGAFFAPAAPAFVIPASWTGITRLTPVSVVRRRAPAHAWRSRAPPQTGI